MVYKIAFPDQSTSMYEKPSQNHVTQLKTCRHHRNFSAILFWLPQSNRIIKKKKHINMSEPKQRMYRRRQKLSALIYCMWGIKKRNYWKKIWTPNRKWGYQVLNNNLCRLLFIYELHIFLYCIFRVFSYNTFYWIIFASSEKKSYNDLFIVFRMWLHFSSD